MKLINRMLLLFAALVSFSACEGDYDMPDFTDPTFTLPSSATLTTISAIRGYESQIGSDGVYRFSGTGVYLKAVVSANDKSGNIFKKIYLQDATGNIEMEVDQSNIFNDYPVGQEVYLDLTGLSLSKYGGELQLGHPDGYNYRTPYIIFKEQAHKNGSPNEKAITVTDVTDFTQLKESDRFSLVRLKKVHFENGGKNKFAPQGANYTTEKLLDSKGNSIDVRTSNYAKFAAETLPAGVGTVVAILGRYNGAWQLTIRSLEDFTDFGSDSESGLKFKKVTTVTSGKKYIIAANDNGTYKVAQNVAATKNYSYLFVDDATAKDGVITMDDESHAFTFVANGSDWYIKDESGRYMFMTGTYNSFNVGADATAEGLWTVTPNADGTMKITNKGMSKYIQYSTQHTSYGSYLDEQGIMPELFELQDDDSGSGSQSGTIFSETFETSQGSFTVEDITKPAEIANIWNHDAQYKCMKATAYVSSTQSRYASESMTVSPLIDLTTVSNATLKFEHCGRYFDGNISQMCTVWIKAEGGSWEQLTGLQYNDESKFTFTANTVDLAKYCGKKIQIGFKYTSTSTTAGTYEVRNVSVEC